MMRKSKLLAVLIFVFSLAMLCFGITACGTNHEHTADTAWQSDATYHWHNCTADDGEEMDKAEHTWQTKYSSEGHWQECTVCGYTTAVTAHTTVNHDARAATCTEIGWEAYVTCSDCDYTTYSEISALGHDYAFIWSEDGTTATYVCSHDSSHTLEVTMTSEAVAATCTTGGGTSYTATVYDTDGTTVIATDTNFVASSGSDSDPLGHDYKFVWNEAGTTATYVCQNDSSHTLEVTMTNAKTDATCGADSYTVYTATVYGDDGTTVIAVDTSKVVDEGTATGEHDYDYVACEDGTGHYQECSVCGAKTEVENHTPTSEGLIQNSDGTTHYYLCSVCGEKYGEAEHSYTILVSDGENGHHYECTCGKESSGGTVQHTLVYASDGANGHYQYCSVDGCDYQTETAAHTLTYVSDGEDGHHQECSVCGYATETVSHDMASTYSYNDEGHYTVCTADGCNYTSTTVAHTYSGSVDSDGYSTDYTCSTDGCGYSLLVVENGVITAYNGTAEKLVIPAELNGTSITSIGASAFANNTTLVSVKISEGILSIGESAFSGCSNLASVYMPSTVASIYNYAFKDTAVNPSML